MSDDKARKPEGELPLSLEDRQKAIKRLREILRGSLPADFKFDREEANSRSKDGSTAS
ncbi:hypothetical protein D3C87_2183100 [compost metagenome]